MKPVCVRVTLGDLWKGYAGNVRSGRFPCPVQLEDGRIATHIYMGFGSLRLEAVSAIEIANGKKGFKGEVLATVSENGRVTVGLDWEGKLRIRD